MNKEAKLNDTARFGLVLCALIAGFTAFAEDAAAPSISLPVNTSSLAIPKASG